MSDIVERLRITAAEFDSPPPLLLDAAKEITRLRAAILDIDAHASGLSEDGDGFTTGGYIISVGCLHRALGVVGHSARKCEACEPSSHDCDLPWLPIEAVPGE